jgi:hypothetical protein
VHDDSQYGSTAYRASWFLNFKNRQVFLAHPVDARFEVSTVMEIQVEIF